MVIKKIELQIRTGENERSFYLTSATLHRAAGPQDLMLDADKVYGGRIRRYPQFEIEIDLLATSLISGHSLSQFHLLRSEKGGVFIGIPAVLRKQSDAELLFEIWSLATVFNHEARGQEADLFSQLLADQPEEHFSILFDCLKDMRIEKGAVFAH